MSTRAAVCDNIYKDGKKQLRVNEHDAMVYRPWTRSAPPLASGVNFWTRLMTY